MNSLERDMVVATMQVIEYGMYIVIIWLAFGLGG